MWSSNYSPSSSGGNVKFTSAERVCDVSVVDTQLPDQ